MQWCETLFPTEVWRGVHNRFWNDDDKLQSPYVQKAFPRNGQDTDRIPGPYIKQRILLL